MCRHSPDSKTKLFDTNDLIQERYDMSENWQQHLTYEQKCLKNCDSYLRMIFFSVVHY